MEEGENTIKFLTKGYVLNWKTGGTEDDKEHCLNCDLSSEECPELINAGGEKQLFLLSQLVETLGILKERKDFSKSPVYFFES